MTAKQENHVLRGQLRRLDKIYKACGIHRFSSGVKKHFAGRRVPFEKVEAGWNDLAHLALGVTAGPLQELGRNGVGVGVARLSDEVNKEFQEAT